MDFAAMREQYGQAGVSESDLADDPVEQFRRWFAAWLAEEPFDANVAVVATVDDDGWPQARAVLLKGVDDRGFVFFTNYESDKGRAIDATGRAALTFVWREMERQVRVESDDYFASRPRGAQLGAWASAQSTVIEHRHVLEARVAEIAARHPDVVPRPPHWGGFLIRPRTVEFWQGRADRLHDRLRYRRAADTWTIERLAP
jgi:pyridoxamine 5'-phosphate oxidase